MSQRTHTPTHQQVELVRWTASLGAVTPEALADRLGITVHSARARLAVAQRCNLLTRDRPLSGRPPLFTSTRAGLRACDSRGIKPCRVSPSNANHLIVCAAAAAGLERSYPDHRLMGERELRRDEREHGGPLASARFGASRFGDSRLHRPDLVLWPSGSNRLPVAVEIELTIKAPRRLVEICRAWARCRTVAGVLYLVPPAVELALSRAVAEARAGDQVLVAPLASVPGMDADVARDLTGESQSRPQRDGAQQI